MGPQSLRKPSLSATEACGLFADLLQLASFITLYHLEANALRHVGANVARRDHEIEHVESDQSNDWDLQVMPRRNLLPIYHASDSYCMSPALTFSS